MAEDTSSSLEDRLLNRALTERVLDRAASDPQWKQQLLDDPESAMREANFPEAQRLEELRLGAAASKQGGEVQGQWGFRCPQVCLAHTIYWQQAEWTITAQTTGGLSP
jgi:hypothetical protein